MPAAPSPAGVVQQQQKNEEKPIKSSFSPEFYSISNYYPFSF